MDEGYGSADETPIAGMGWILCGLALLAASPFVPQTPPGWIGMAVAAFGFLAWTHVANPPLPLPIYGFQVLVFNFPLVAWWISLTSIIPTERWLAPAMAVAAVGLSFSVGAVGLYVWLMFKTRPTRIALLLATTVLLGISAAAIYGVHQTQTGSLAMVAALATTLTLLLQRLLALPFDDDLLGWRTKGMALAGGLLAMAFLRGLLPVTAAPALVYGGGWLLAGALFTVIASLVLEARSGT